MNQNKIRTHPTYRKRPAFRPGRDAGRSLMFLRDFSDKQQHRAYGREHADDDADDGLDLSGFRVLLFLYEVAEEERQASATPAKTSFGVFQPRHFLGRELIRSTTESKAS